VGTRDNCLLGRALYFAESPLYSCHFGHVVSSVVGGAVTPACRGCSADAPCDEGAAADSGAVAAGAGGVGAAAAADVSVGSSVAASGATTVSLLLCRVLTGRVDTASSPNPTLRCVHMCACCCVRGVRREWLCRFPGARRAGLRVWSRRPRMLAAHGSGQCTIIRSATRRTSSPLHCRALCAQRLRMLTLDSNTVVNARQNQHGIEFTPSDITPSSSWTLGRLGE
jgi:hypothetical protein